MIFSCMCMCAHARTRARDESEQGYLSCENGTHTYMGGN